MLWDLNEGKHLYTLNGGEVINALVFSPNRYWLCAATGQSVKIWVSQVPASTCCSVHGFCCLMLADNVTRSSFNLSLPPLYTFSLSFIIGPRE